MAGTRSARRLPDTEGQVNGVRRTRSKGPAEEVHDDAPATPNVTREKAPSRSSARGAARRQVAGNGHVQESSADANPADASASEVALVGSHSHDGNTPDGDDIALADQGPGYQPRYMSWKDFSALLKMMLSSSLARSATKMLDNGKAANGLESMLTSTKSDIPWNAKDWAERVRNAVPDQQERMQIYGLLEKLTAVHQGNQELLSFQIIETMRMDFVEKEKMPWDDIKGYCTFLFSNYENLSRRGRARETIRNRWPSLTAKADGWMDALTLNGMIKLAALSGFISFDVFRRESQHQVLKRLTQEGEKGIVSKNYGPIKSDIQTIRSLSDKKKLVAVQLRSDDARLTFITRYRSKYVFRPSEEGPGLDLCQKGPAEPNERQLESPKPRAVTLTPSTNGSIRGTKRKRPMPPTPSAPYTQAPGVANGIDESPLRAHSRVLSGQELAFLQKQSRRTAPLSKRRSSLGVGTKQPVIAPKPKQSGKVPSPPSTQRGTITIRATSPEVHRTLESTRQTPALVASTEVNGAVGFSLSEEQARSILDSYDANIATQWSEAGYVEFDLFGKRDGSTLLPIFQDEFETYKSHSGRHGGTDGDGQLLNMWHSLAQQAIRQDPLCWILHVCLRIDRNYRLVSTPSPGRTPSERVLLRLHKRNLESGFNSAATEGVLSLGGEDEDECDVILEGSQSQYEAWMQCVQQRMGLPSEAVVMDSRHLSEEDKETFGLRLARRPCEAGWIRIFRKSLIRGALKSTSGHRNLVMPSYVAIDEAHEIIDSKDTQSWDKISLAHTKLMPTMEKAPNKSLFPVATTLDVDEPICRALVGKAMYHHADVVQQVACLLGEDRKAAGEEIKRIRWKIATAVTKSWKMLQSLEPGLFPDSYAFFQPISRSSGEGSVAMEDNATPAGRVSNTTYVEPTQFLVENDSPADQLLDSAVSGLESRAPATPSNRTALRMLPGWTRHVFARK